MATYPDALEISRKIIRMDSTSDKEQECARYLGGLLSDAGFAVQYLDYIPGATSVIAELPGKNQDNVLAVTGHIDTVPFDRNDWQHDPLGAEIIGGKLYGRGASDMKTGVAAFIAAALKAASEAPLKSPLQLIITAGEEKGCKGAAFLAKQDGLLYPVSALVVAEPSSNYPMIAHKGVIWLKGSATGKNAHGSMPHEGINAIYKAVDALANLKNFDFGVPDDPILGKPTFNVGKISGGEKTNIVPGKVEFTMDVRITPGLELQDVLARFQNCFGPEIKMEVLEYYHSLMTSPDTRLVREIYGITEEITGEKPEPRGLNYFTDASELDNALGNPPIVIFGPGEANMCHKVDEYCYAGKISQAEEIFFQLINRW